MTLALTDRHHHCHIFIRGDRRPALIKLLKVGHCANIGVKSDVKIEHEIDHRAAPFLEAEERGRGGRVLYTLASETSLGRGLLSAHLLLRSLPHRFLKMTISAPTDKTLHRPLAEGFLNRVVTY